MGLTMARDGGIMGELGWEGQGLSPKGWDRQATHHPAETGNGQAQPRQAQPRDNLTKGTGGL